MRRNNLAVRSPFSKNVYDTRTVRCLASFLPHRICPVRCFPSRYLTGPLRRKLRPQRSSEQLSKTDFLGRKKENQFEEEKIVNDNIYYVTLPMGDQFMNVIT